ncbi:hypothetical protein GLW20_14135, partial [Virgibacillus halodenitrificans]|nr:hypothetical protein [Virgibacillus halodenitrificans]
MVWRIVFIVANTLQSILTQLDGTLGPYGQECFLFSIYAELIQEEGKTVKKYFRFEELGTNYRTEFMAGMTTFL